MAILGIESIPRQQQDTVLPKPKKSQGSVVLSSYGELTLCIIQPSLSQLIHPLKIIHCIIRPKPVAPQSAPSDSPSTITSRLNISPIISLLPSIFPYCLQFSAPSLIVNNAVPSQNNVKKPWNGESALSAFCRSKAVNCLVKTKSLNLLLLFLEGSFSYFLSAFERLSS